MHALRFLAAETRVHPFDDGAPVGMLLALSGRSDVVDAHLVVLTVRLADDVLAGDYDDLAAISTSLSTKAPVIHRPQLFTRIRASFA